MIMISEVTCVKNGWLICASEIDQEEYCVRISDIDSIDYSLIDGRSRIKLNNGTEVNCDGNVIDLVSGSSRGDR
jgi:hypothetical protein